MAYSEEMVTKYLLASDHSEYKVHEINYYL